MKYFSPKAGSQTWPMTSDLHVKWFTFNNLSGTKQTNLCVIRRLQSFTPLKSPIIIWALQKLHLTWENLWNSVLKLCGQGLETAVWYKLLEMYMHFAMRPITGVKPGEFLKNYVASSKSWPILSESKKGKAERTEIYFFFQTDDERKNSASSPTTRRLVTSLAHALIVLWQALTLTRPDQGKGRTKTTKPASIMNFSLLENECCANISYCL